MFDEYKTFRKDKWVNPNGEPVTSEREATERTRKGARAHTINFELRVLKLTFNLAKKWGYVKENPTEDVTRLKVNDDIKTTMAYAHLAPDHLAGAVDKLEF